MMEEEENDQNQYLMTGDNRGYGAQISTMSKGSGGTIYTSQMHTRDPHIRAALQIDPKFVDKNIHETLDRLNSYDIHQKKIFLTNEDLQLKRMNGV